MTTKFIDFQQSMITELTDFIRTQSSALSLKDLDRLMLDLPRLRKRVAKISSQTYPYLPKQLEFLSLFVEERIAERNRDLAEEPVGEAAFALLYFQRTADLIPDSIPGMGLLDDAMLVSMVLRRYQQSFKESLHSYMVPWGEPEFDVDQLLSVISPIRVTSFLSSLANRSPD
jgi:uncharacterized membrane protein YkvA (DUF1232 family)